jgi:Family of unknown function (DUF6151)
MSAMALPMDVPLRCACGAVRGVARGLSASRGHRVVCYCDDCQAFAHFLGGAERILDGHGGTDVFQTSAGRLELREGRDRVACVRLTRRGPLRWYASCCRTPIANTPASPGVPFAGVIHSFLDTAAAGKTRDEVLGPVRTRIYARFATGDRTRLDAHERAPLRLFTRIFPILLAGWLRRDHLRSPFFDAATREPIAEPHTLAQP